MPNIDFSNVRLTIQQFQSVSDGKFNAGEVRLTSETGIEKVNNFVGRKWKNKESISHAEVIAIKQAFVKALQEGGVGDDALRRVREQLGLDVASDGRTAVVTITLDTNLEVGDKRNDFFGNALVQERITVDLTPDVPAVTDIRLSQELR